MAWGLLGGLLLGGAKKLGTNLANKGVIGGSLGKILRTSPGTALIKSVPKLPATLPKIGGMLGTGVATAVGGKSLARKGAELIAAGLAFEAGGKLFNSITGKEIKQSRRMNPGNTRALKRSVRRINSAAKMYGKVLSAQKGKRHSGYTIKPKAKCR
jgi:hypothetical protein